MQRDALLELLSRAVAAGCSDVHLKAGSAPRARRNGSLRAAPGYQPLTMGDMEAIAEEMMSPDQLEYFHRSSDADFTFSAPSVGRFRVNALRQRGSIAMVLRHVAAGAPDLDDLGLPSVIRELADEHRGLVLVTGPTGSGKTSTLAGMVHHINRSREACIVTLEDPIEIIHDDIRASVMQREIGADSTSWSAAMRAALRQDPDVILIGEMRDPETIHAALSAAETGHLVFSTLHTSGAIDTINRIIDTFPADQQGQVRLVLASQLKGVVSQRLVPTVDGGRVAACEVMRMNGRVARCIEDPTGETSLEDVLADGDFYGMQTFEDSLFALVQAGTVSPAEARVAATSEHSLKLKLDQAGLGQTATDTLSQLAAISE